MPTNLMTYGQIAWPDDVHLLYEEPHWQAVFEANNITLTGFYKWAQQQGLKRLEGGTVVDYLAYRSYEHLPEFLPVLTMGSKLLGYWVDHPAQAPQTVALYTGAAAPYYRPYAENLVAALRLHVEERSEMDRSPHAPPEQMALIKRYATGERHESGRDYLAHYASKAARIRGALAVPDGATGMGILLEGSRTQHVEALKKERAAWVALAGQYEEGQRARMQAFYLKMGAELLSGQL